MTVCLWCTHVLALILAPSRDPLIPLAQRFVIPTSIRSLRTQTQSQDGKVIPTHLHHLQLLDPLLHKLLYPPLVRLGGMFAEAIARPSLGVFAEVVCGELAGLAEERAILQIVSMSAHNFPRPRPQQPRKTDHVSSGFARNARATKRMCKALPPASEGAYVPAIALGMACRPLLRVLMTCPKKEKGGGKGSCQKLWTSKGCEQLYHRSVVY